MQVYNNVSDWIQILKSNVVLNNVWSYNNTNSWLKISSSATPVVYYGKLSVFGNNDGVEPDISAMISEWNLYGNLWWTEWVYSSGDIVSFDMFTNPSEWWYNDYLLDWTWNYQSLRWQKMRWVISKYSYGTGILTQVQPVLWSGNTLVTWWNYMEWYYIGSSVKKVTWDLEMWNISNWTMTATGKSNDILVWKYTIFGDNQVPQTQITINQPTNVSVIPWNGQKMFVTQLFNDD